MGEMTRPLRRRRGFLPTLASTQKRETCPDYSDGKERVFSQATGVSDL